MLTHNNYLMRRLTIFLLLLGILGAGIPVFAGPPEPDSAELESYFEFVEEELVPVTTGVSRPMAKEKMPATITVVTASELKFLGLRHLTDVINYIVPGGVADLHRGDRSGLYNFRGISVDNNAKYIFMVDGVNNNFITAKGAFNERYLGLLDELDRIEITQGVGSTLYGDGAISGVINFITKTGKDFQGVEITSGYGSWEKYEETVKYGRKTDDENHDFFYFGFKRSDGSRPRGGGGDPSIKNYSSEHAAADKNWDHYYPSFKLHGNIQRGDFTLRMRFVRDKFEEPYVWTVNSNGTTKQFDAVFDRFVEHNYLFVQPEIKHKFNEKHRIEAKLAFQMAEVAEGQIHDWIRSNGDLRVKEGDKKLAWGERKLRGQLFYYYDGWENHKLTSGIDLFRIHIGPDFKSRNFSIAAGSGARNKSKKHKNLYYYAVFFEDIWQLDEKTNFFAGVRVENHKQTPTNISPRFAVTHDLTEKTNLKLLYNTGYRTPPWVYYTTNDKTATAMRPDPEKVQSWEAHVLHKWTPKFSTALVGYYTIYKDLLSYWNSTTKYYNFPEVKAAGLELSGDYRTDKLKLKFSHSYSRPVHASDNVWNVNQLTYNGRDWAVFPTHMTKIQAIINLIEDKCVLGLTYMRPWGIRGQRNADSKLKWPRNLLNATLTMKLKKDLELQVSGYNLTGEDRPWWGSNTYDGISRDVNPHTEYFVRLLWKF